MSDCLDRRVVLETLEQSGFTKNMRIYKRIESLPTFEAAPVVYGRWVEIQTEPERLCRCSECGYPGRSFWNKTNYCPNCGVKMDGEQSESSLPTQADREARSTKF